MSTWTKIRFPDDEKAYLKEVIAPEFGRGGMTAALRAGLLLIDPDYPLGVVVEGQPTDETLKAMEADHADKLDRVRAILRDIQPQIQEVLAILGGDEGE